MNLLKQIAILAVTLFFCSCVQDTQPKTITIKVDMTGIENPTKVGIRGANPLSWNETTFLNDDDGDDIYEETFEIFTANYDVEFKFVNNNDEFELQDQNNRSLTFEYKPETIIYEAIFDDAKTVKITRE